MLRGLSVERSLARKGRSLFLRKTECCQRCQFSSGGDNDSTIRCAIVGSGPAGFYTAKYLLEKSSRTTVDILESLPTPYGLVRQGVAPDHQEVKSVMSTFKDVAKSSRFRFFGNVAVGSIDDESIKNQISIDELKKAYDVVVLAYGASSDKELDIPGERLNGVLSARSFVNWYNGHPNYKHIGESFDLKKVKRVVVIGQGNVAIDCARILLKSTEELEMTDISAHALAALKESSVEEVVIIGRRGHIQASFTIKEIRELTKLDDVSVHISQAELDSSMTEVSKLELENSRPKHRIVELINKIASDTTARGSIDTNSKKITFRFLLTPERISGTNENETDVASLTLAKNKLTVEGSKQKATATEEKETIECELILKSVGYQSESMAGVPFDTMRNVVPNHKGRVILSSHEEKGFVEYDNNLFVCGWLKRGPSGIIGTNITDAKETVESILEDIALKKDFIKCDPVLNIPALSSPSVICWEDYLRIECEEERRGTSSSPPKPREKICDIADLLVVAKSNI